MTEDTFRHTLALRTVIVCSAFSLLVAALLLVDYANRVAEDPLNTPQYAALKARVSADPRDAQTLDEIRVLDQRLREHYFHRKWFSRMGAWMLVVGLAGTLAAARWTLALRRRLPHPEQRKDAAGRERQVAAFSRRSVAVAGLLAAALSLGLYTSTPDLLRGQPAASSSPGLAPGDLPPTGADDRQLAANTASPTAAGDADSTAGASPTAEAAARPADTPGAAGTPGATSAAAGGQSPVAAAPATQLPTEEEIQRNWPRFRGPAGTGVASYEDVPTQWDAEAGQGIRWKTPVPVPGNGSPIVWDKVVFLSGATAEQRAVMAFAADSGELLWETEIPGTEAGTAAVPEVTEATGFAAPTPVTDGQRVYAIFANGDLGAVDFSGKVVWTRGFGVPKNAYGHAASLAWHQGRLIVQLDQASKAEGLSKLIAVDAATGKIAWEQPREVPNSWPSPIVIQISGQSQIVTAADPWVIAYAAEDGREIWRADCLQGDVGPSPTFADGVVYVANEFPGAAAIRADGSGDVTETHVLWEADLGAPDCCSPLVADGRLLLAASYGAVTCYDAKAGGEPLWEAEFDVSAFVSSPSQSGRHVYLFDEEGTSWVVEATAEGCETVAENKLGESCVTSPAFQPGRLYIRGQEHLFCLESDL